MRKNGLVSLIMAMLLAACSSPPKPPVPVVDLSRRPQGTPGTPPPLERSPPTKASPSSGSKEIVVKKGDTLYAIANSAGLRTQDILTWNGLTTPDIHVGQTLRLHPPTLDQSSAQNGVEIGSVVRSNVQVRPGPATPPISPPSPPLSSSPKDQTTWTWPTQGSVETHFAQNKKGVEIVGTLGQPIVAAANGKVVYVGSGIRGYGNLIIIKHTDTLLSAYAHNRTIVVKEGQAVHQGQKIAEMGSSDSDKVKLHFEIREQGKPTDPLRFLPNRP